VGAPVDVRDGRVRSTLHENRVSADGSPGPYGAVHTAWDDLACLREEFLGRRAHAVAAPVTRPSLGRNSVRGLYCDVDGLALHHQAPDSSGSVRGSAVEKAVRNTAGPGLQRVWRAILERLGERVAARDLDELIRQLEPVALTPAELRLEAPTRL